MSGPRLQLNTVDGLENCSGNRNDNGMLGSGVYHTANIATITNRYPLYNHLYLGDTYDGRQTIGTMKFSNVNTDYESYGLKRRFALRTTTPGYFVIISVYHNGGTFINVHYARTDVTYPYESTISAKTLIVKLPFSNWRVYSDGRSSGGVVNRTNSGVWYGNTGFREWCQWVNANCDGFTASGAGYVTSAKEQDGSGDWWQVYTFEFPASYYAMRVLIGSFFERFPMDMQGKKFGSNADNLNVNPGAAINVTEVYSPQKGCMALKSYINGEIPILN